MVYIDANIALELLLDGRAYEQAVTNYLSAKEKVYMSMLSVHLVWHFGRKVGIADDVLRDFTDAVGIVSIAPEDYVWARKHEARRDFEDALQVAAALRVGASEFVTLNQSLIAAYETKVGLIFVNPSALNS
ncbi:MAG: PIN domain-containing protein [Candidatus Saccharimonadales bacterium]